MKYKVTDSLLTSPKRDFKRGEVVTEKDLTDNGIDVEFLKRNNSITPLEGTETAAEKAASEKAAADKAAADKIKAESAPLVGKPTPTPGA